MKCARLRTASSVCRTCARMSAGVPWRSRLIWSMLPSKVVRVPKTSTASDSRVSPYGGGVSDS